MIAKRTFEALKYPPKSAERIRLNNDPLTSEYMTSYKWEYIGENCRFSFRTKKEAEEFEDRATLTS
jgi:hypothetical protein